MAFARFFAKKAEPYLLPTNLATQALVQTYQNYQNYMQNKSRREQHNNQNTRTGNTFPKFTPPRPK